MMKELAKNFDPSVVEERLYNTWMEKKYFHTEVDKSKKPFCIVMPPPNITGQLHMGHALDNTMQDILIRWKRMSGYNTLWVPGIDHASISTELKVVQKMASEGLTKEDVGREGFLERAWAWKEEYGGIILNQLRKLGCSCDWDRVRFTMDEGCSDAVLETFCRLYEKGYIYRGEKIINWCPECQTTISDAEVEHKDMAGHFYHINYPVVGSDEKLRLATTRPETMLGDTAVAVHPEDERYRHLIGKTCIVPILNKEVPIIADDYVDREFGTGVVKITPAHDPNDFEVGLRHDLPRICVMNDDGTMNENAGSFAGMDRMEARKAIVKQLEEEGYLAEIEDITHAVGCHERCHVPIEPMIKLQWFVKMDELAKPAIRVYQDKELKFVPERFGKIYMHWLDNIRDWCISRQLWWGHRIPAYYCADCGHITVSKEDPGKCEECGSAHIAQDEDTLHTWFSSALWPFSVLGWPKETEELKHFYPTSVLVTGYDIIFFWVIRMVFSGNDMRFYWERLDNCRNFCNKLWNASRFVMMHMEEDAEEPKLLMLTAADKWILSKVNTLAKEVQENLSKYDLGLAAQKVYDFIWDEYCDWYIEMVKPRLYNKEDSTRAAALWTLKHVLLTALKLMHLFMPYITEELFLHIQDEEETIMTAQWPVYKEEWNFKENEAEIDAIKEAVRNIRNIRAEMNVAPAKKVHIFVVSENEGVRRLFEHSKVFFQTLAHASDVSVQSDKAGIAADAVSVVVQNATIYMPLSELVDFAKETERLEKEREKLSAEVARVEKKLANQGFVAKAPADVIAEERAKGEKYQAMLAQVEARLAQLKK